MDVSSTIQLIATLIEAVIALLAVLVAWKKKRLYGWFIAVTFGLFVIFDLARIFALEVSAERHAMVLLIACISMLCATWLLWKEP
jgi:hypothetical protein